MSTTTSRTLSCAASIAVALALSTATAATRPLVTILATMPGPTAPTLDQQNKQDSASNIMLIPSGGLQPAISDIFTHSTNGACSAVFSAHVDVQIDHPMPDNLTITLSTLSSDQKTLRSQKLYPDPRYKTMPPDGFDLSYALLDSTTDCSRWRLMVTDASPVNMGLFGVLKGWTLTRRMAIFPWAHDRAYYEKLVFGGGSPQLPVNVNGYFQAVSSGKFKFTNEGFYEASWSNWAKSRMKVDPTGRPDGFFVSDMVHMLESAGFNFQAYDLNRDGEVSNDELAILAFDNSAQALAGMNRSGPELRNPGDQPGTEHCTTLVKSALKVCSKVAFLGQQTNFETLTHELSHSLGTVDLYAEGCFSQGMTLMSCTIVRPVDTSISDPGADNMLSIRLDPWHRHQLSWLPYQDYGVASYRLGPEYGPAVFRNSANPHEYYIFEERQPSGPWDSGMASFGIVVWHVRENADGSVYKGADGKQPEGHSIYAVSLDKPIGGNRAWSIADGIFRFQWDDTTLLPVSFQLKASAIPGVSVTLEVNREANGRPPVFSIVTPADNSTVTNGISNGVAFRAVSSTDPTARIDWFSSADGRIGTGASGVITSYSFFAPGTRIITAVARSTSGAIARKSITLKVDAGAPKAAILSPADGSTFQRGQPFRISGNVSTPTLFSLDCNSLEWSINRDPKWSAKGCNVLAQFDFIGPVRIFLRAVDDNMQPVTVSIGITLVEPPPSGPPIVAITSLPLFNVMPDRGYRISGVVTDPAGGAVTYRWTVFDKKTNRETQISTAGTFSWVPQTILSEYTTFELRLYGTKQSNGAMATAVQSGFVTGVTR